LGVVKFGGLPRPGASVRAVQGEKRLVAVTDIRGFYLFPDLADGAWTLRVEMQCFAPATREVAAAANVPAAEWELDLLPLDEIKATAPPPSAPSAAAAPPAAAPKPETGPAKGSRRGGKPAPEVANTPSGFQRTEATASGDAAQAAAEGESLPAPDESNQAPADGFLINGSVNNG